MSDVLVRVEVPTGQGDATDASPASELTPEARIRKAQQSAVNDFHPTEPAAPVITGQTLLGRGVRSEAELSAQALIHNALDTVMAGRTVPPVPEIDPDKRKTLIGSGVEPEPEEEVAVQKPQGPDDVLEAWRSSVAQEKENFAKSRQQQASGASSTEPPLIETTTEDGKVIQVEHKVHADPTLDAVTLDQDIEKARIAAEHSARKHNRRIFRGGK